MRDVYILGAAETPVTKNSETPTRELGAGVIRAALSASGVEAEQIGALYVGNMLSGTLSHQQQLGSLLAEYAGLGGVEAMTVEAACASGGAAARTGYLAVAGGAHDLVVVCGVERMTHVDSETVTQALATAADWDREGALGESFLSLNARLMHNYMETYGATAEDFAPFAINAHNNAARNPNAMLRKGLDLAGYLESRVVADPIRLFDASPICDGAAALVLGSERGIAQLNASSRIRICGSAVATSSVALERRPDTLQLDAVTASTTVALGQAQIDHGGVDFFELHDAYTIMAVLSLESAGFAAPGTGTRYGTEGRVTPDGDLPISTFGGLKARGHPVGASGVYQLTEAYRQLSGTAGNNQLQQVECALVQCMGGTGATVVSHVLRRES